MSSHQDVDGSALSHAGRKPKTCGICFREITSHFERHFKLKHRDDKACVVQWLGGTNYVIIPYKSKRPASEINKMEEPNNN